MAETAQIINSDPFPILIFILLIQVSTFLNDFGTSGQRSRQSVFVRSTGNNVNAGMEKVESPPPADLHFQISA